MIVVDTSVAMKWLRTSEKDREQAMVIFKNHLEHKEEIIVPDLFYIEAANALATNTMLSTKDISEGIEFLFDADLNGQTATEDLIVEAALLARKYHVSVYDMLYAVIAKIKNTVLITADQRFIKNVNLPYVKPLTE